MWLLDLMRGRPTWARELPAGMRPSPRQIRRLEALRTETGAGQEEFLMYLMTHPETTRRLQRHIYGQIKRQMRRASEREILKQLVMSRLLVAIAQGSDLFGLAAVATHPGLDTRLDDIVAQHPDVESVIDAIIEDEEERLGPSVWVAPSFDWAAQRVTQILRET